MADGDVHFLFPARQLFVHSIRNHFFSLCNRHGLNIFVKTGFRGYASVDYDDASR